MEFHLGMYRLQKPILKDFCQRESNFDVVFFF